MNTGPGIKGNTGANPTDEELWQWILKVLKKALGEEDDDLPSCIIRSEAQNTKNKPTAIKYHHLV